MRSTSAWFSGWLDRALDRFRDTDGHRAAHYSVVIGEPKAGAGGKRVRKLHILYRGTAPIVRTRDLRTLTRALFSELSASGLTGRDDAIYLAGGAIRSSSAASSALVPGYFVSRLARLRRRAELSGLLLPASTTVALDLDGRRLLPLPALDVDPEAFDVLSRERPGEEHDPRAFVDEPIALDALLSLGPSEVPGLSPMPRSLALYRWSSKVLNLGVLGGAAIRTLGELVREVPCHQVGWHDPATWLGELGRTIGSGPASNGARGRPTYAPRGSGNTRASR